MSALQESEEMYSTVAWAKTAADSEFSRIEITRNVSWAAWPVRTTNNSWLF